MMSTKRFMKATAAAVTTTTPSTVGRSWVVALVDREPPEPLDIEHALGDDRAADEQGDVETEDRHDRRQARAQPVLEDHLALGEPLGARRADVVLAERLEQVVTRQPGVDRHVEQGEDGPRQDHVAEPLPDALIDRRVAGTARESREPRYEQVLLPDDVERHQARARRPAPRSRTGRSPWQHGRSWFSVRTAERTPIVTPNDSQMTAAPRTSRSVRGARVMISLRTET